MIGAGTLNYAKEDVAINLAKCIERFNTACTSSSLKKVIMAVNDNESKRAIKKHFPDSSQASVGQESVKVTFLGVDYGSLVKAESLLKTCCSEHIVAIGYPSFQANILNMI